MTDSHIVPRAKLNVGSIYGVIGFSIAVVVHASTFTARSLSPDNPLFSTMHIGIFPLFIPMVFRLSKWNETTKGFLGLSTKRLQWRAVVAFMPPWAVMAGKILAAYSLINFFVAIGHLPTSHHSSAALDAEQARYLVRAFSGHWLIFYGLPALVFLFVPPGASPSDAEARAS